MSSLLPLDLENLVRPTFNIDLYDAKSGDNKDVVTLAFRVSGRAPAEDLENFIEKEGSWILDTDVSSGEDHTDHFLVFVEIKRNQQVPERIVYILDLIERVSGVLSWNFTVGNGLTTHKATEANIETLVSLNPRDYEAKLEQDRIVNLEGFFSATPFNKVVVEGNNVKLQQFYALPTPQREVSFTLEDKEQIAELQESDVLESTQTIWLQKTLGHNYVIEQYGDKFLLSRPGHDERYLVSINV